MYNNDLKYILIFLSGKNLIIKLIDMANKKYLKKKIYLFQNLKFCSVN